MLLSVNNLQKTFYNIKGETIALKDISFNVDNEEFISIIGPSGCGKSTILNLLSFIDKDYNGKIKYNVDNPVIGYMLQSDALFDWLSVLDNATLGLKVQKKDTKENIEYVKELLNKYGLKDFINSKASTLSGGMKQRVALIRTLAIKPDILLLDEPYSALDYQSRLKVSDDVYKIIKNEKKTVIMVTHDIAEAISSSDRIIVLSKRPAIIKNIYCINLTDKKNPIHNRKAKEFIDYYDLIWKEIDESV